jgi:hypothetical protein
LEALPEELRKKLEATWNVGVVLMLAALPILGAGIALWFMGPAWFNYRGTHVIRAISIGLMVGAPLLFIAAVNLDQLAAKLMLLVKARGQGRSYP